MERDPGCDCSWSNFCLVRAMCPQDVQESNSLTTMMLGLPGPGFEFSERDCLNLNVFAPRLVEHVPVICYIHGGLTQGGNALPKNDAANIVKKSIAKEMPVVVVTINYRLLPSAELLEAPPQDMQPPGQNEEERVNWGLHDQKIALEWVRKHIHNFGGNPNEITLMGHSNGASSAGYHMLTAQHDGLFKRAIMHSGSRDTGNRTEHGEATEPGQPQESQYREAYLTSIKELLQTAHRDSVVTADRRVEEDAADEAASFTFMSDACMPYMSEREKQAGFAVIDRWIDFAWGNDSNAVEISSQKEA
ncbi:Carboxylesterase family-domain-containing protein [Dissophora ornata]|nr:Carboxylesterase family-domain-containing protein [Dissophora ornata]